MKKLLIITGPQGSGNHLFSRILSTGTQVGGWKGLLENIGCLVMKNRLQTIGSILTVLPTHNLKDLTIG